MGDTPSNCPVCGNRGCWEFVETGTDGKDVFECCNCHSHIKEVN